MKRSGFKRPAYARPAAAVTPATRRGVYAMASGASAPVPKEARVECEPYRRLVASLPCIHCGFPGPSQAAHPNTGKGAGLKTDDRLCFPLCAPRFREPGCHARFDQGALFTKEERRAAEPAWAAETIRTIRFLGLWPAGLELPAIEGEDL